jgi:lysozyme family protein
MTAEQIKLTNFIKKWEGGLSRDKNDSASSFTCPTPYKGVGGYHTNKGITYKTWVSFFGKDNDKRFFEMNDNDWFLIFSKGYYDPMKNITNDELLLSILSSWAWGSGVGGATRLLQKSINTPQDGIWGAKSQKKFDEYIKNMGINNFAQYLIDCRRNYFVQIATGNNAIFLKGWLNRLVDFRKTFL